MDSEFCSGRLLLHGDQNAPLREFQASLVCGSQRGEDVPATLMPGERRSEEARRRHFYYHAGSGISNVRLSTVLVCVFVVDLTTHFFDWTMEVMCGAMLATSARVSVLARMKEVGAILRLTTVISGESIMNDKGAVVVVAPSTSGLRAPGFPVWSVATFIVVST